MLEALGVDRPVPSLKGRSNRPCDDLAGGGEDKGLITAPGEAALPDEAGVQDRSGPYF